MSPVSKVDPDSGQDGLRINLIVSSGVPAPPLWGDAVIPVLWESRVRDDSLSHDRLSSRIKGSAKRIARGQQTNHDRDMPSSESTPRNSRPAWPLLLLVLAGLGIVVRLGAVFYLELWHDELFSLDVARLDFSQFLDFIRAGEDFHPPGFYFAMQLASMFGLASEHALRIVNLVWFLVPVLGLGFYARRFDNSRFPIAIALACIAVGPSFVYHGAELRMYSMLLAFSSVGLLAARLAAKTSRWRWFVAFGFVSLAGALTHYSSAIVAASLGLALLWTAADRRRALCGVAVAALIVVIGLVPLLGGMQTQMAKDPAYTIPLYLSLLYIILGPTLPLLLVLLMLKLWGRKTDSQFREVGALTLGDFSLRAALVFTFLFLFVRGLLGVNLVNTGVSLVPATWLILGAAWA